MNNSIIIILLIIVCSCDIRIKGYSQEVFSLKDPRINKAWKVVCKEYFIQTEQKEQDVFLYPIALYKKLVNGMIYKIFFAAQIKANNDIKLYDYVAFCKSYLTDPLNFEIITTNFLIEDEELECDTLRYRQIMNSLIFSGELLYAKKMIGYQHFFGNCGIYVVYGYRYRSSINEGYFVFEDEEERCKAIAQIKDLL